MDTNQNDNQHRSSVSEFERPSQVSTAVVMIYLSLGLGILDSALLWTYLLTTATVGRLIFVQVLTVALIGWLSYKIWRGRNWARITFAALWIIGVIPYIPTLAGFFHHSTIAAWINLLQTLLQLCALCLVFLTPGRVWFASHKAAVA